jgi:hypothetical protein
MSSTELLKECRDRNWASAETAPAWAKARILEIRSAVVEKRSIPAPSREFIADCEQRSLSSLGRTATRFAKKLFRPAPHVDAELESLRQRAFVQGQGILADFRAADVPLTAAERDAENARRKARVKDIADAIREMGETL